MLNSLRELMHATGTIDVHEHHLPQIFGSKEVSLSRLFRESYASWTKMRAYRLPSEPPANEDPSVPVPTSWEALAPYLEHSGSNAFVRNLVYGILELHDPDQTAITRDNFEAIDAAVRSHHRDPQWLRRVIRRAGIERIITDPYLDPMLNARETLGAEYDSVLRINAFAVGWNPESRCHNGNCAHSLLRLAGMEVKSFDDYCTALRELVAGCASRNQVALKNALAYDRDLNFDEPDELLARQAWGKVSPSPEEKKAFSDFIVDLLCRCAAEHDLPVQTHLGTAIIRGSHPLNVAGLIERHPRTRFLLMHFAYPWSRDLLGLAFVYRNVWLDVCWAPLLSPSHFKLALHEAIEVLPDETRIMLGGDCLHIEESYGAMQKIRHLTCDVLEEKVANGYFAASDAERLAGKIARNNAASFFNFPNLAF
ncbi:amidohydrolase family protein [Labrys okinawensis]|uniref:amidohydrolase family protein n=1 Tax=Labrys okinawensis TaxID=346911 RepID=UPI0039BC4148